MKSCTRYFVVLIGFSLSVQAAYSQENILWEEDFEGLTNGDTVDSGPTAWSSYYDGEGLFSVQPNPEGGNSVFLARDTQVEGEWVSDVIDISSIHYAEISLICQEERMIS